MGPDQTIVLTRLALRTHDPGAVRADRGVIRNGSEGFSLLASEVVDSEARLAHDPSQRALWYVAVDGDSCGAPVRVAERNVTASLAHDRESLAFKHCEQSFACYRR